MRRFLVCLSFITALLTLVSGVSAADELFEKFQNPPAEAKPFVRWWWGENSVVEEEIIRQIDFMDKAGIGGFEINPIALPTKVELSSPPLEWLSPEFNKMIKVAVDESKKRGMITDLIVGSGWPFGAEFLKPGEMTKRFYVNSIKVEGPVTFTKPMDELKIPVSKKVYEGALKPKCIFIHMAPADISDISQSVDITGKIAGGKLTVDVPAGKHVIHVGLSQEAFTHVYGGSPGAKGPVLDHYNAAAVRNYLNKMSGSLGPALGGKMGPDVRAIFCDSIELSAANWTTDMPEVFKAQHGYDVLPYLPYINNRRPIEGTDEWSDTLRRVRYDWSKTMVSAFQDRFIKVYHKWCNDNGCLSRYQAYGLPWLMGMLDSYLIPDIPETNNWVYPARATADQHGFLVWSKYCASAGHIMGRKIISSEAMTNTSKVFQTTLDRIKAADDYNFIMGVNHSVLHGYTYSPLAEGPHARIRFGAYFSDQNTWWPYFKRWADYNARLSAVFQASEPVVKLAIMGPRSDIWGQYGLERPPFHEKPWYLPQLWKVFSQCGSNADHINEPIFQNAEPVQGGKFKCGEMTYDALIIAGADTIEPETAQMIRHLAARGVKIVFINKVPTRGPSLNDRGENDKKIKDLVEKAMENSPIVVKVDAPEQTENWKIELLEWADELLNKMEIKRDIKLSKLDPAFYQKRVKHGDRDIFFLVNTDSERTVSFKAGFNTENQTAVLWNPETGKQSHYTDAKQFDIELPPHGSMLLVYGSPVTARVKFTPAIKQPRLERTITGTWDCKFVPAEGKPFSVAKFDLKDIGKSKDQKLNTFSGVIEYSKTIEIANAKALDELDLGTVHGVSEVTLNGKNLGCRWYGEHKYDIKDAVKKGNNQLKIKVTTTLYNSLRNKPRTTAAGHWANRGRNPKPVSSGLVGPIKIN